MIINIFGSRGSLAVPDLSTLYYGGNTTCLEAVTAGGTRIIMDAGTGIRALGEKYIADGVKNCSILITHTHWDHIQGFPFFSPIYVKGNKITIYSLANQIEPVKAAFGVLLNRIFHPISLTQLKANVQFKEFNAGDEFHIGDAVVKTCITQHPIANVAYRIDDDNMSFVFTGDHEGGLSNTIDLHSNALAELMRNADAALVDSMYTDDEYLEKEGWGHSSHSMWIKPAAELGVKRLFLGHHNSLATDEMLDNVISKLRRDYVDLPMDIYMAQEGCSITEDDYIPMEDRPAVTKSSANLLYRMRKFSSELAEYNDVGMILDRILLEARKATRADAGTFYLVEDDKLSFAYVHNDTLFSADSVSKHTYSNASLTINESTIAGHVAYHSLPLKLDDVYAISPDKPYSFNPAFDRATGYRTQSVLAVPVLSDNRKLQGVIQLINSKNPDGTVKPFTHKDMETMEILTMHASSAIVRSITAKTMLLRMLALNTMRDPKETKGHFLRVGAYSAEIFHNWADKRGMDIDQIKRLKDHITLAAMLHDVGKVGIPDAVMLKPGKLTDDEFKVMTKHTILGASLFDNPDSSLDEMISTIARYHHEKWNGTGYRGEDEGIPLRGEEIPWAARITAVADVFDALNSKRVYKEAWSFEDSVEIIKNDSGSHFDPEIVEAFLEILDTLKAIQEKYGDS